MAFPPWRWLYRRHSFGRHSLGRRSFGRRYPASLPPAFPSLLPPAFPSLLPSAFPSPLPPAFPSLLPPAFPSPLPARLLPTCCHREQLGQFPDEIWPNTSRSRQGKETAESCTGISENWFHEDGPARFEAPTVLVM